jgi:hypothetical protein
MFATVRPIALALLLLLGPDAYGLATGSLTIATAEAASRTNCDRAAELLKKARRANDPTEAFAFYRLAEMAEELVWTESSTCDFRNWVEANQGRRRSLSPSELQRANRIIDDWFAKNDLYKGVNLKSAILTPQGLLDWAAAGNASAVRKIIEHGIDRDERSPVTGATALMLSAGAGWRSTVDVLVTAGADVNLRDDSGKSALDRAVNAGHNEIAKRLRRAGAK